MTPEEPDLMADLMRQVNAERELAANLQEHAGQWVAVRDHEVVADAPTVAGLLDQVDADSVDGIFQVAEQGTACFF